ncbi:sushi domain-containing protein 2-like [Lytechinus variegatus]|uniref:sushi domain-containing protein 2-like n=1 Tax=Lytechinus variegatus TaxID=7654 RepID=UPI001BB122A5|nr:sushi domain-containing protein 2-like [Lytechinus variegatus]
MCRVTGRRDLYPYGLANGDVSLRKENDFAQEVVLDRDIPFGGRYHRTLYISDNGVISFDDAVFVETSDSRFRNLPLYYDADGDGIIEDPDAIFAFWSDVDITDDGGNIYYRVTTSQSTLDKATHDVRKYFRSNVNFRAQVVIVVTWDQVSFYNQVGDQDPRNTFQVVLVHDGYDSYVILLYDSINWVVGTRMNGDSNTGLYGSSRIGIAIIGFLMADGVIAEVFAYDQDTLLSLPIDSNVEVNGVYAYKIDQPSIIDPLCNPANDLIITPTQSGMMGGEPIYLYGPCWVLEIILTCVFTYNDDIIQEVNATVVDTNKAYCIPDPFFLIGEVIISVVREGNHHTNSPSTVYTITESNRVAPTITRGDPDSPAWYTAGNELVISWEKDEDNFGSSDSALSISVLAYREDDPGPRWEKVYDVTSGTKDDGSYAFTPSAQSGVTEENAFGVIRITGNSDDRKRVLWSDVHPLSYLLEDSYQDNTVQWASDKCNEWITSDDAKGIVLNNRTECPCTLDQAEEDVGRFITDVSCHPDGGVSNCARHQGAIHCLFAAYPSPGTMSGTTCCYDANRLLMHSGDTRYAGTDTRSHIRGAVPYRQKNLVPELSLWSNDVMPKYICCEWANDDSCSAYMTRRPTADCVAYEPPVNAISFGDPHFITMDRYNFTFNGLGEYTLLRYAREKTGYYFFELQGRMIQTYNGERFNVTQLSAIAMKDLNSDTIFIEAGVNSGLQIYRKGANGVWRLVYFSQQTLRVLQGCAVEVTRLEREDEIYELVVTFEATGISVRVTYSFKEMLAVQPILPTTLESDQLFGLLGNMDGNPSNDLQRRDSNGFLDNPTEEEIFQFGQTWEIEADNNLLRYTAGRDHSDYHDSTFVPLMDVTLPTPYSACEGVIQCLFDYEVSGYDHNLAMATLEAFKAFENTSEIIRKVDSCPYQNTPKNGNKTYASDSNQYFKDATVTFSCKEGWVLSGSAVRTCDYSSNNGTLEWTGSETPSECIASVCGSLQPPDNGYLVVDQTGTNVSVSCNEGYSPSENITCNLGSWNNLPPQCLSDEEHTTPNAETTFMTVSTYESKSSTTHSEMTSYSSNEPTEKKKSKYCTCPITVCRFIQLRGIQLPPA